MQYAGAKEIYMTLYYPMFVWPVEWLHRNDFRDFPWTWVIVEAIDIVHNITSWRARFYITLRYPKFETSQSEALSAVLTSYSIKSQTWNGRIFGQIYVL